MMTKANIAASVKTCSNRKFQALEFPPHVSLWVIEISSHHFFIHFQRLFWKTTKSTVSIRFILPRCVVLTTTFARLPSPCPLKTRNTLDKFHNPDLLWPPARHVTKPWKSKLRECRLLLAVRTGLCGPCWWPAHVCILWWRPACASSQPLLKEAVRRRKRCRRSTADTSATVSQTNPQTRSRCLRTEWHKEEQRGGPPPKFSK